MVTLIINKDYTRRRCLTPIHDQAAMTSNSFPSGSVKVSQ
jgi:hypothetical protein